MKRAGWALSVMAVLALLPPVGVEAKRNGHELAGTNFVTATRSSWMQVTLPRPVRISTAPFDNPLIEVASSDSLAGVVLRQDVRRGIQVVYVEGDLCDDCSGRPLAGLSAWDPKAKVRKGHMTLPAGRYQLYVIVTGRRTTARIELPGLSGRKTLAPDRPAELRSRPIAAAPPPSPHVFSAEVDHTIGVRGLSFVGAELDTERFASGNFSACIEVSDGQLPGPTDPAACEGGPGMSGTVVSHTLEGGRKVILSMGLLAPGSYEHQLNYRTASVVRRLEAREFVLEYATNDRSEGWLYSHTSMW